MITQEQLPEIIGTTAYSRSGEKIGKIGHAYYDARTHEPKWATVQTGLFGNHESFVPLRGAELDGDHLGIGFEKSQVKDAPQAGDGEADDLPLGKERQLSEYYGLGAAVRDGGPRSDGSGREEGRAAARGRDEAMTRSEERMRVGTEQHEAGRARLRKHVVTENVQTTVPVSHEEAEVVREPITEENRGEAMSGPSISEGEHEVVLHEERPVVDKEVEPVERVRIERKPVQESETVQGEVRKEQIEAEGAGEPRRGERR